MPKFIKFIYTAGMTAINTDDILMVEFNKNSHSIKVTWKNMASVLYEYQDEKSFKTMSDAIMEQLEI